MKHLISISELGRTLDVTPAAVHKWIDKNIIPAPSLEGGSARLYTNEEVEAITKLITKRRNRRLTKSTHSVAIR